MTPWRRQLSYFGKPRRFAFGEINGGDRLDVVMKVFRLYRALETGFDTWEWAASRWTLNSLKTLTVKEK